MPHDWENRICCCVPPQRNINTKTNTPEYLYCNHQLYRHKMTTSDGDKRSEELVNDEHDEETEDRKLNNALFPAPGILVQLRNLGVSFSELKAMFPERVRLARLDDIFVAWKESHDSLPSSHQVTMTYPAAGTNCRILYDFDNYTYRSTVASIKINGRNQLEIQLANDGFIYPPKDSLAVNPTYNSNHNRTHHKRTGLVQLSDQTVKSNFPALLAGAKSILGVQGSEKVYGQVLYHDCEERVDFLFRKQDSSWRILISFEPGWPEHFHEDDPWGKF